ncbi:hypothetical protein GGR53DRAFT_530350 [Hypoxylon sp. FL1150]|nr:hypothetical protein GGR53DRAFT_530350 [Hypoxylon sp. FL1150]
MADDKEDEWRTLRRLAKSYGISFKRQADEWPDAHTKRFRDIQELGDKKFSTYSENVTVRSVEEPWTRQIKFRTMWVVNRACDLAMNVQPRESGWRLGLENDIMHRFLFEVACPKCRARIWRSEIEAVDYKVNSRWEHVLEERRKNRKQCQCPPESRPQDPYAVGTNMLFDDRVEEIVLLDSAFKDLPKKKMPDRTFGLKTTEKVNQLLERIMITAVAKGETFEFSPFKSTTNAPIFPFLILEAKSDSSKNGFQDIQTQSAFPVWKFLTLQRQLQLKTPGAAEEPLVWFLGNRGSEWKVYGCYVDEADGRPRYNMHPLWGGDLTTQDSALQLILIVDYIMDWARDIYRPSIIRELKSLASEKAYDEVSLGLESDIYSVNNRVLDWIQPPASNSDFEEHLETVPEDPEPHASAPPIELANSVSRINYRFNGLNITEQNAESLLVISQGPDDKLSMRATHAQSLDAKLRSRSNEVIVTTQHTLDEIENMWTGEQRDNDSTFSTASKIEAYAILEYRCFLNTSWEIVKELTCLAVSKPAFAILQKCAFPKKRNRVGELPNTPTACPSTSIYEAINCLLSDSGLQSLTAAISSTLMLLHASPIEKDNELSSSILDLRALQHSQIGKIVDESLKCARNRTSKRLQMISLSQYLRSGGRGRRGYEAHIRRKKAEIETWTSKYRRRTANRSFARTSTRSACTTELKGHDSSCSRCSKSQHVILGTPCPDKIHGEKVTSPHGANWEPISPRGSTCNTILVQAVTIDMEFTIRQERNDFCLFIFDVGLETKDRNAIAEVVEEHLNNGRVCHSLLHGSPTSRIIYQRAVMWNLPLPYRPYTKREQRDLEAWKSMRLWDSSQIILHYLRNNLSYWHALERAKEFRDYQRTRLPEYKYHDKDGSDDPQRVDIRSFWEWLDGKIRF